MTRITPKVIASPIAAKKYMDVRLNPSKIRSKYL